jgi:hypothetical protein
VITLHDGQGHPLACPCGKPATNMHSVTANPCTGAVAGTAFGCDEHPAIAISFPQPYEAPVTVPGEFYRPQHESPGAGAASVTRDTALANAVRLLNAAEMECDLAKMERYEKLADSWIGIAGMLGDQDRV